LSFTATTDTIVAVATAPRRGGIGIVRISGPDVRRIGEALLAKPLPPPRSASVAKFHDDQDIPLDEGIALFFIAPHSYTGEDVLELQAHGGPIILEALVSRAVSLGARRAAAGEFTQRAFLNDKLDLAQAEAVADLIDAGSIAAARAAMRSLQGDFSKQVHTLVEKVIELRTWVEAAIDFPEEEVDFLADQALTDRFTALREQFKSVLQGARRGRVLRDGMTVVITGRPNAGKSSLLNALAGHEAAIVTPIAGTTRDVLHEYVSIDGMPVHIADTAGLRDSSDVVEIEGIRRAQLAMQDADRVLFVVDADADPDAAAFLAEKIQLPANVPVTVVFNKIDKLERKDAFQNDERAVSPGSDALGANAALWVSAMTGAGLAELREHLKTSMNFDSNQSGVVSARARHVEALQSAERHTDEAVRQLKESRAGELVAEELRAAQEALGEITGEFCAEDLLGRIFGSFCIGK